MTSHTESTIRKGLHSFYKQNMTNMHLIYPSGVIEGNQLAGLAMFLSQGSIEYNTVISPDGTARAHCPISRQISAFTVTS